MKKSHLDSLRSRIEARRNIHPGGLPPAEYYQDGADVDEHNRERELLKMQIEFYEARASQFSRSVQEFNRLVADYNAGR